MVQGYEALCITLETRVSCRKNIAEAFWKSQELKQRKRSPMRILPI